MTIIHNSDIQRRIIDEAKLQVGIDSVPQELAEKVLPVLVSNPKGKKRILIFTDNNTRSLIDNGLYVPVGKTWKFLGVTAKLVTNGTVQDRGALGLEFLDPTNIILWEAYASAVQIASKDAFYMWMPSIYPIKMTGTGGATDCYYIPLNDKIVYREGSSFWFYATDIQVGDSLTIAYIIEETDSLNDPDELIHTTVS